MDALVLSSGGVDSTTALALALERYGKENVLTLALSYGQKHSKELTAAQKIADYYRVMHRTLDLSLIFKDSDSALLQNAETPIPHASYHHQLTENDSKKPVSTYVPFRNGLFLSTAAAIALSHRCSVIYYGAHADDAAGSAYPDCSPAFHMAMKEAIYEGSGRALTVEAPFIHQHKKDIVALGLSLGVPYELTWSCYEGNASPCGRCATCLDRMKAFSENGVTDPLLPLHHTKG